MTRPHSNYEKSLILQLSEDALSNNKNGTPSLRLPPNLTALRKRLELTDFSSEITYFLGN